MNNYGHGPVYAENPEYQKADGIFEPTWQSLQSVRYPEWFWNAKLGFWAQWGRRPCRFTVFGFKDICTLWKAEKFNPYVLMQQCQQA